MEESRKQESDSVIVGRNAVLEALRSGRGIECLYVHRRHCETKATIGERGWKGEIG